MTSMAAQGFTSFSLASVIEDVLQQQAASFNVIDLASRKADEASTKRNEAARWLRRMAGVVLGKDLPAEPSEDDFRIGLRSGIILCNVLNKVIPGAISKVVELSNDSVIIPDGATLLAYQYFENVANFLAVVEDLGIPTFEASDFEKGGNTSRMVECVLGLKSYAEWKHGGGSGSWNYDADGKAPNLPRPLLRMHSEPSLLRPISRSSSLSEKSFEILAPEVYPAPDPNDMNNSNSISVLVRAVLSGKRQDEAPTVMESLLNKILEEYDHRLGSENELLRATSAHNEVSESNQPCAETTVEEMQPSSCDKIEDKNDGLPSPCNEMIEGDNTNEAPPSSCAEMDDKNDALPSSTEPDTMIGTNVERKEDNIVHDKDLLKSNINKQQSLIKRQQKDVKELKSNVNATKQSIQNLQLKYQEDIDKLGKHLYSLAKAASGYHKVLAENRKLYNIVQDLKGNIRVYCRVRPFLPGETSASSVVDEIEEGTITIQTPTKYYKEGKKSFTFNKVFGPSATQVEVFTDTQPLVRSVLDGYNVCIFAYGQTGSGKTFTMSGPNDLTEESFGVNYRALNDLFFISQQRKETVSYEVSVQMMEIYNEQLRDLLVTDGSNKRLDIRNSSSNGINVPDANRLPVSSTDDVINLMNLGQKNRAVCATAMNDRSSRSHSCLTVHVQGRDLTSGASLRGSMHLVDLAGSERVEKSEVTGDRLKEAVHINKSLSALGDVITALAQKGAHIPYRNSKLTQLLQDSLGGQAKTLMFVHVAPDPEAVGETLSTLKFAERVSSVELGAAQANKDKEQTTKATLAKKEEEPEMGNSSVRSNSPDNQRAKSNGRRSPMNEKRSSRSPGPLVRRRSLDPQDLSAWPPHRKGEEKLMGTTASDNVDRRRSLGALDVTSQNRGLSPEPTPAEEIDEFEAATSEILDLDSETSLLDKRTCSLPSAVGSKKRPMAKPKLQESRSMIPSVPTRRLSVGSSPLPSASKNERPGSSSKRRTGSSK